MLCVDTSSLVAYLGGGAPGPDIEIVDRALADGVVVLSPVTVAEMISEPLLDPNVRALVLAIPTLPIREGYWERAGLLRTKLLRRGRKAKLADTLIAQSCLDDDATLVTRDHDFAPFSKLAGLRLLP